MIWRGLLRTLVAGPVIALLCTAASAQTQSVAFNGTWRLLSTTSVPANVRGGQPAPGSPPPTLAALLPLLKPEVAGKIAAASRAAASGGSGAQDRGYCVPPSVTGPAGFFLAPPSAIPVGIEILSGPGSLTMLDETSLVRRIYMRAQVPVDALDESHGGTSIAHLEGKTLVVQTTGLNSVARVILGIAGTELGGNAQLLERMTLVEPNVLEIVTTLTAPELLRAPMTSTARFRRGTDRMMLELSLCFDNDRSYDLATGKERFDATPPVDLPPPPAN